MVEIDPKKRLHFSMHARKWMKERRITEAQVRGVILKAHARELTADGKENQGQV